MSDERRKDHAMRQRIDDLQASLDKQKAANVAAAKANAEDREKLIDFASRLKSLMWGGIACVVAVTVALVIFGFSLGDRADDAARLSRENASLVKKLDGEIARSKRQRQKSAENACNTRRENNEILIRIFVPPEVFARVSKKDRDALAGPDDCAAYGRSVTTDEVPAPKRGTASAPVTKEKK
jgi:multidrug efflux pump subunit AcrA (membrane-fusion protein)